MIHKQLLFITLIALINYFSFGFHEKFKEYKHMNYFTLQNNIQTNYFKCLEHYNLYVKPIQDKTKSNDDSIISHEINFEDYLEYWWNLEESEIELLNRVCDYINNKYPKKFMRFAK